jgi:hypothetical protein
LFLPSDIDVIQINQSNYHVDGQRSAATINWAAFCSLGNRRNLRTLFVLSLIKFAGRVHAVTTWKSAGQEIRLRRTVFLSRSPYVSINSTVWLCFMVKSQIALHVVGETVTHYKILTFGKYRVKASLSLKSSPFARMIYFFH